MLLHYGLQMAPSKVEGAFLMPEIVIANRLRDGLVVFMGIEKKWVERAEDCAPAEDAEAAAELMSISELAETNQEVIGASLIEVEDRDGVLTPIKMREAIRAKGPTVRKDLGKQAGN